MSLGMAKVERILQRMRANPNDVPSTSWRPRGGATMPNSHYTYRVTWSPDDEEHVATCVEFPSLSWLDGDEIEALRGIRQLVAETVADLRANGEAVPEPLADREYSGRFLVRTTPDVHRRLALEAAEAKVSLNRYVNAKLAAGS
jgi:predicted HicB family RNase H-like nuclease